MKRCKQRHFFDTWCFPCQLIFTAHFTRGKCTPKKRWISCKSSVKCKDAYILFAWQLETVSQRLNFFRTFIDFSHDIWISRLTSLEIHNHYNSHNLWPSMSPRFFLFIYWQSNKKKRPKNRNRKAVWLRLNPSLLIQLFMRDSVRNRPLLTSTHLLRRKEIYKSWRTHLQRTSKWGK